MEQYTGIENDRPSGILPTAEVENIKAEIIGLMQVYEMLSKELSKLTRDGEDTDDLEESVVLLGGKIDELKTTLMINESRLNSL